jgi:hypothetical protein
VADTISLIGKAKALILRIRQSRETGFFFLLVLIVIIILNFSEN